MWPDMQPRTGPSRRIKSPFRTGFDKAISNVAESLRGFQRDAGVKIEGVTLSTNCDLLNRAPIDPGAVAWFMMDGEWIAFGMDRFCDVASNIQAIHHILEARRIELRYGGLAFIRQTFRAFKALPAPGRRHWREVFGFNPGAGTVTAGMIESAYRVAMKRAHPDHGGSQEAAAELNAAREAALKEIGL